MEPLQPFYKQVQAHYDLSNEFFALFLDPSMTYSSPISNLRVSRGRGTAANIELALGKCDLRQAAAARHRLRLGIDHPTGNRSSWNSRHRTDSERTTIRNGSQRLADLGERAEIRLQGWEEFDEPVDRIVSIGAFEHFREERYAAFFSKCHRLLPADGRMLLHSIVKPSLAEINAKGLEITHEDVLFNKFILKAIFPGGQLRPMEVVQRYSAGTGRLPS